MDIIERAARAIYHSFIRFEEGDDFEWPDVATSQTADDFREAARAVLSALRDPDEGMIEAGDECAKQPGPVVKPIWQAMIDQALKG